MAILNDRADNFNLDNKIIILILLLYYYKLTQHQFSNIPYFS